MKPTIIRLSPDMLIRLQACASATSTSVAQVIRLCIERRLPVIEAAIKEQQERPCESAKFAK
jgi:predicted DNA-binding protein